METYEAEFVDCFYIVLFSALEQTHSMQSHIHRVHVCLAVTCHLHFWQNDQDLLRATAVTLEWNRYQTNGQHRKGTADTGEENS